MNQIIQRKNIQAYDLAEDSLQTWFDRYIERVILEERSEGEDRRIRRLVSRFIDFFQDRYGHDRVSVVVKKDVVAWLDHLYADPAKGGSGFAASNVNTHQSALNQFMKWLHAAAPHWLPKNPTRGVRDIKLPEPDPRALSPSQITSLKNLCDRLDRYFMKTDRRRTKEKNELRKNARPLRDRAIIYTLLSTGLRREELVMVNKDQVEPPDPKQMRLARSARIVRVKGKGKTEGTVYLSPDARAALADYLEAERILDASAESQALFLAAAGAARRKPDGRLTVWTINHIVSNIGQLHDKEYQDPARHISPLTPHDLRHTFGVELVRNNLDITKQDLERMLRHRNDRYLALYTNPPGERGRQLTERL